MRSFGCIVGAVAVVVASIGLGVVMALVGLR